MSSASVCQPEGIADLKHKIRSQFHDLSKVQPNPYTLEASKLIVLQTIQGNHDSMG